jgi:hypothetical protein
VAGVEDDKPPLKEDTLRETPAAKTERASVPDDWKPPPRRKELTKGTELGPSGDLDVPAGGARVDVGLGDARVRSFVVKGPLAVLVGFVVFAVVGITFALVFVFALGIGAAFALGAAALAVLGMGAAGVARLTGARRRELEKKGRDR